MDALLDEVESLEAILMDDVRIERTQENIPSLIETTVFPLVGEDTDLQQCVCITLQVLPTPGYPDNSPEYKLVRPRGLDDGRILEIKKAIDIKLKDSLGIPVVFDLIEVVREHLSDSNLPSGQCVICLYGFCEGDEFTRTECFHYLHSYCLARHLNAMRRNYLDEFNKLPAWQQKTAKPFQAQCPVCRENINDDGDSLRCAMPPSDLQNAPEFEATPELRELQQRMSALFIEQKSRGAIIDVENETAAVISIETEQEIRRREQRKRREEEAAAAKGASGTADIASNNLFREFDGSSGSSNGSVTPEAGSVVDQSKDSAGTSTKTNFAPVIQPTQRDDPTNNNYHHGRRHQFRGGRRHHHHHHNQHQSQRDRERFEHNHIPSAAAGGSASSSSNATTSHSSDSSSSHTQKQQSNNKQAKAHGAGHGHNR